MPVAKVEVFQSANYDCVISMLDYYHPDDWLRLWPQDGVEYMSERMKEFLEESELPLDIKSLVLNMKPGEEAVLLKNSGKGLIELYLI